MDPLAWLGMTDPRDRVILQSVADAGQREADDLINRLARAIRNEIADMIK